MKVKKMSKISPKTEKNCYSNIHINTSVFNKKNMSGITLIALVVSIIVIVIIASVTISGLVGEKRNNNTGKESQIFY